jgi:SAM-dependent methyltransferase
MVTTLIDEYLSGARLQGDDFDDDQLRGWFEAERTGYFDVDPHAQDRPQYEALHELALYRFVPQRQLGLCLALGTAAGNDVAPLAPLVDRFYCIEPARTFWRERIGGKPATYVEPSLRGQIGLPDASAGAAVAIGVLHHIPNVTEVVTELGRVLAPGGVLLVLEPAVSMGDWRRPRSGLTAQERGIPPRIMLSAIERAGLHPLRVTWCDFPPVPRIGRLLGVRVYQSRLWTRMDLALSALTRWNHRYHRTGVLQKLAPASLAIVAEKRR